MSVIKCVEAAGGNVEAVYLDVRKIIEIAINAKATNIIVMHNHPSGNPEPSKDDLLFTKRVWEAGALVDIPLLDHIVIGDQQYFSFRQEGLLS